jgi:hypothetical protein
VFFKATLPDGTDFHSGTVAYRVGETVSVSESARRRTAKCCTDSVLHASTVPAETLIGGEWPCRLFEVTGRPVAEEGHKRGFRKLTVLREVDAHLALGPQGEHVAALIQRAGVLSAAEAGGLHAARDAARDAAAFAALYAAAYAAGTAARYAGRAAAWVAAGAAAQDAAGTPLGATAGTAAQDAALAAAWDSAWDSAQDAALDAAWDAARALVVRDLIGQYAQDHYDLLTRPWASVIGPVHPDDKPEGVVA